MSSAKRKRYSNHEQMEMIRMLDSGVKRTEVMEKFGIKGQSYITGLLKRKEKLVTRVEDGIDMKAKSVREGVHPSLEAKMKDWISSVTTRGGIVSRELMQSKAREFASEAGVTGFNASDGWMTRFARRNGIAVHKFHGEAGNVSETTVASWKEKLMTLTSGVSPKDIMNVDELGLMYQLQSSQTHAVRGQRLANGKRSKVRVTVLVGANMDGTEKLPLLVIGKSANPRCFKGMDRKPLMYENNKTAWMTNEIFKNYLQKINKKMIMANRKIHLFMDNCSSHDHSLKFSNIQLHFFPQTQRLSFSRWTRESFTHSKLVIENSCMLTLCDVWTQAPKHLLLT